MRKTIFLDLQNTILSGVGVLDKTKREMLEQINAKNNLIISSNVFPSDMSYFNEINGLNINFISASGTYLKYDNLHKEATFLADLSFFNNYLKDLIFLFYEKDQIFYIYGYQDRLRTLYPIKPKDTVFLKDFSSYKPDTYNQIVICIHKNSKMLSHLFNKDSINLEIIAQDQTKILYKILKKHVNKGYFIPLLLEYLETSFEDTISAGDSLEDLYLFKHTKLKICPINACEEIKSTADIIVPSYLDNGVLTYLVNNT